MSIGIAIDHEDFDLGDVAVIGCGIGAQDAAGQALIDGLATENCGTGLRVAGGETRVLGHRSLGDEIGADFDGASFFTYDGFLIMTATTAGLRISGGVKGSFDGVIGSSGAGGSGTGGVVEILASSRSVVGKARLYDCETNGVYVNASDDCEVEIFAQLANAAADDTYDAVYVAGDANKNRFKVVSRYGVATNVWRSGVNIDDATADDNRIIDLDGDTYGTAPIIDLGADTRIGPASHEWDLGLAADRVDAESIRWDAASQRWTVGLAGSGGGGAEVTAGTSVKRSSGQTITTGGTGLAVAWNDGPEGTDDGDFWDTGVNERLTAPVDGWYLCTALIDWNDTGDWYTQAWFVKNTATGVAYGIDRTYALGIQVANNHMSWPIYLTAGDYMRVYVHQNSGDNLLVTANSRFAMLKL